jgi:hypothetical protein
MDIKIVTAEYVDPAFLGYLLFWGIYYFPFLGDFLEQPPCQIALAVKPSLLALSEWRGKSGVIPVKKVRPKGANLRGYYFFL